MIRKSIFLKTGLMVMLLFFITILVACNDNSNKDEVSTSDYPKEQINMVIPHDPGGASDLIFRLVAKEAEEYLDQKIVPVNISGASGTTAAREVMNADPDGYTIFGMHNGIEMAHYAGIFEHSVVDSFEPIAHISQTPNIFTVNSESGWANIDDVLNYIEENPGEFNWGHVPGSTDHFFIAQLMDEVGINLEDVNLIPYEGSGELINDLLAGHIDGIMDNLASGKAYFGNEFTPLGLAHDERLDDAPDIQTIKEQDIDMVHSTIRGFIAPKDTPEEVLETLESAFEKALESSEVQEQMAEFGTLIDFKPHDEFQEFLKEMSADLERLSEDMEF